MKVLHIIGDLGQGGIQNYVCDLVKYQADNYEIDVSAVLLYSKGVIYPEFVKYVSKPDYLNLTSARSVLGIYQLYRYLKQSDADIVHVHVVHPFVGPLIKLSKKVAIFTEHGGGLLAGRWQNKLIYRYFYKCFCRLVANSRLTAGEMLEVNRGLDRYIDVVHNGLDLSKIHHRISNIEGRKTTRSGDFTYQIGVIARLVEQKNVRLFLEIAKSLVGRNMNAAFFVVGDGPELSDLENFVNENGLTDNVFFLGYRQDQIEILNDWDLYLFTSKQEAFGLAIIEAMATGVPVVAIKQATAVNEIIDHNINGIIIDSDDPKEIADKIDILLRDTQRLRNIATKAKVKACSSFSMKEHENNIFDLYKECIKNYIE